MEKLADQVFELRLAIKAGRELAVDSRRVLDLIWNGREVLAYTTTGVFAVVLSQIIVR